jgi:hypothetical protein
MFRLPDKTPQALHHSYLRRLRNFGYKRQVNRPSVRLQYMCAFVLEYNKKSLGHDRQGTHFMLLRQRANCRIIHTTHRAPRIMAPPRSPLAPALPWPSSPCSARPARPRRACPCKARRQAPLRPACASRPPPSPPPPPSLSLSRPRSPPPSPSRHRPDLGPHPGRHVRARRVHARALDHAHARRAPSRICRRSVARRRRRAPRRAERARAGTRALPPLSMRESVGVRVS